MVELWKESPQGLVKEGDTVELRCQGDGNPPSPFIFNKVQVRMDGLFLSRQVPEIEWLTHKRHVGNVFDMQSSQGPM